ncbi:FAD-dependent oxidoreductase, partial [Halopseudomonas sp.]|uniref:FAD-dependent oxidoreductase n=1 Tax=Halopseudomonas sp. TaxID=2901191 RepID=UPI00356759C0
MTTPVSPLVLVGAGHAHLVAMRRWIDRGYHAPKGAILISPTPEAWYSGMMPGLIAGRFSEEQCAIELAPLCRACGLELIIGEIVQLDAKQQVLTLAGGRTHGYEHLSLNVGSIPPQPRNPDYSVVMVPAKPFAPFANQWQAWCRESGAMELVVLGGGPAAFELVLALHESLPQAQLSLICGNALLEDLAPETARQARNLLIDRGIALRESTRVERASGGWLMSESHRIQKACALVIATGAAAHPWQGCSGLDCDESGFIRINPTLQSISHPQVLASGDCAALTAAPRSGVYAVRAGAILAENIPRLLAGQSLQEYRPQQQALVLMATADGGALLSYGRWSAGGRLPGILKDHLD